MSAVEVPGAAPKRKSRFAEEADDKNERLQSAGAAVDSASDASVHATSTHNLTIPLANDTAWVEHTPAMQAEDDAVRRRREKLAQWKAKQAAAGGHSATQVLPLAEPTSSSTSAGSHVTGPVNRSALGRAQALLHESASASSTVRAPSAPASSPLSLPPVPPVSTLALAVAPVAASIQVINSLPLRLGGPRVGTTLKLNTAPRAGALSRPIPASLVPTSAAIKSSGATRDLLFNDADEESDASAAGISGSLHRRRGAAPTSFEGDDVPAPPLPSPPVPPEAPLYAGPAWQDGGVSGQQVSAGDADENEEEAAEEAYHQAFLTAVKLAKESEAGGEEKATVTASPAPQERLSSSSGAGAVAIPSSRSRSGEDMDEDVLGLIPQGDGAVGTGLGLAAQLLRRGVKRPRPASEPTASSSMVEVDEEAGLYDGEEWGAGGRSALETLKDKLAAKTIKAVDHSKVEYAPFLKDFYVEHPDIGAMRVEDVAEMRAEAEIAVRGKGVPRPVQTWDETGLPSQLLSLMPGRGFASPFNIQKQALPVIMSGRDVIGVARTGSGKTLAYVLPMLRHIMAQEPVGEGEGPIALVLAPARELVVQIFHETRRLSRHVDVRAVAVYGGAPVAEQIGEMKRGMEVLIATPGRLIELLTLNAGKLLSFHRVTYVVLDEADRMFDLGFEPQVTKILSLTRPDRQTVMFSATFPSHVESLARKALRAPVEIIVGGRSKASADVSQWVEVREEGSKFARTLQLLGEWYELGSVLIFVDTQERCDELFAALFRAGYPAVSLHGGKDQADRDQALADFKAGLRTLMVATSVAGRGLDVKGLVLVMNYSCPNHLEDYVHRVGRTGRAGTKGTAFTFITPGEGQYASDLVRALKDAKQPDHVPVELTALAEAHAKAVAEGTARKRASGYSSSKGYKFDETELDAAARARKVARQAAEIEAGLVSVEDILEESGRDAEDQETEERLAAERAVDVAGSVVEGGPVVAGAEAAPARPVGAGDASAMPMPSDGAARAAIVAASIQRALAAAGVLSADACAASEGGTGVLGAVSDELDINDYPQQARFRLMKDGLKRIEEWCGVSITSKGSFVAPGRQAQAGERKLYLLVEGKSAAAVRQAKSEARRVLEEETLRVGAQIERGGAGGYSKYNIV